MGEIICSCHKTCNVLTKHIKKATPRYISNKIYCRQPLKSSNAPHPNKGSLQILKKLLTLVYWQQTKSIHFGEDETNKNKIKKLDNFYIDYFQIIFESKTFSIKLISLTFANLCYIDSLSSYCYILGLLAEIFCVWQNQHSVLIRLSKRKLLTLIFPSRFRSYNKNSLKLYTHLPEFPTR